MVTPYYCTHIQTLATLLQYIPRNMLTVFALLCFIVVIHWLIFPYPSGLFHWHCGNLTIAPVPAKQPWWIWINTSYEFIMNDCITTTKQSTTKPCAYFLGYTVLMIFLFTPCKLVGRKWYLPCQHGHLLSSPAIPVIYWNPITLVVCMNTLFHYNMGLPLLQWYWSATGLLGDGNRVFIQNHGRELDIGFRYPYSSSLIMVTYNIFIFSVGILVMWQRHSNWNWWYLWSSDIQMIIESIMMTSSNGSNFRVTGPLCGKFTGHRFIPLTKASDAELWCFFDLRLE